MEDKIKARFLSLYCMVLADGIVDTNELLTLYRIGKERYGLPEDAINRMVVGIGASKPDLETVEEKVALLYEIAEIACSDGKIDETERNMLKRYVLYYGFKEENVDKIVDFLFDRAMKKYSESEVIKEITE